MLSPPRKVTSTTPPPPQPTTHPSLRRLQISSYKNTAHPLSCSGTTPMPTVNPGAPALGFSDSLTLLSQVKQPADSIQPGSSTPASGSHCEAIRAKGLHPSDPAVTLFSVKWDEREGGGGGGDEEEQDARSWPADEVWGVRRGQRSTLNAVQRI